VLIWCAAGCEAEAFGVDQETSGHELLLLTMSLVVVAIYDRAEAIYDNADVISR
jgi:hypothetical protein